MRLRKLIPLFLRKIIFRTLVFIIPELRDVRNIIQTVALTADNDFQRMCDEVFLRRLVMNPLSLMTSFWKNHFEWKEVAAWKELPNRILDFGCGTGHSDIMLAREGVP